MASATALFAVQKKVYETINVSAVTSLAPVMDFVPEGQAYPYIEIGELEERLSNMFAKDGREVHVTLHIWSSAGGYHEVELVIEQLNLLLDAVVLGSVSGNPVAFDGWKCWLSEYAEGSLQKDFDIRELRHALVRYHFEVSQP